MELEGLSYSGTQHRAIEDARNMAGCFKLAKPMELVNPNEPADERARTSDSYCNMPSAWNCATGTASPACWFLPSLRCTCYQATGTHAEQESWNALAWVVLLFAGFNAVSKPGPMTMKGCGRF